MYKILIQLKWLPIDKFMGMKNLFFIHKLEKGVLPQYFNNMRNSFSSVHKVI